VAATGLLGFNPYNKGTVIDVSKPTNMAIQLIQKDRARGEALDKYFQEYDKTVNPAGMRQQDIDGLVRAKNEAKKFYFENKKAIQNTSLDNGKAYSELMNMYTGASKDIEQSKREAATGKVTTDAYMDAKKNNRVIPAEVENAIFLAQLPIKDPRHKPFDPMNFDAYDRHDAVKYAQNIYSKIKPSESVPERQVDKATGAEFYKTEKKITKDALGIIEADVENALKRYRGLVDVITEKKLDKAKKQRFASEYKNFTGKELPKDPTDRDLAVAYTIALRPQAEVSYSTPSNWKQRADYQDKLIKNRGGGAGAGGAFEFLSNGIPYLKSGDTDLVNKYFSSWGAQGKPDVTGQKVGFKNVEYLPGGKVKINYTSPVSGKGGVIVGVPNSTVIDLNSPNLLTDLSALHQSFLGSDARLEKKILSTPMSNPGLQVGGGSSPTPAPQGETWAQKQKRLKNKK
jgi:hypothetical protein